MSKSSSVTTQRVHERVMLLARLIISGNVHGYSKLEIVDDSTVIIR